MESKSTFEITRWDETVYDETEPQLGRVLVGKAYCGVMEGTGTGELAGISGTARLEHGLITLDHDLG